MAWGGGDDSEQTEDANLNMFGLPVGQNPRKADEHAAGAGGPASAGGDKHRKDQAGQNKVEALELAVEVGARDARGSAVGPSLVWTVEVQEGPPKLYTATAELKVRGVLRSFSGPPRGSAAEARFGAAAAALEALEAEDGDHDAGSAARAILAPGATDAELLDERVGALLDTHCPGATLSWTEEPALDGAALSLSAFALGYNASARAATAAAARLELLAGLHDFLRNRRPQSCEAQVRAVIASRFRAWVPSLEEAVHTHTDSRRAAGKWEVRVLASVPVFEATFEGRWAADEDAARRAVFADIQTFLARRPEMKPEEPLPKRSPPPPPPRLEVLARNPPKDCPPPPPGPPEREPPAELLVGSKPIPTRRPPGRPLARAPFDEQDGPDPRAKDDRSDTASEEDPCTRDEEEDPCTKDEKEDPWTKDEDEDEDPWTKDEEKDPWTKDEEEDPWTKDEEEDPWTKDEREDPWTKE